MKQLTWYGKAVLIPFFMAFALACTPTTKPQVMSSPAPVASTTTASTSTSTEVLTPSLEDATWADIVAKGRKEGKVTVYGYSWTGDWGLAINKAFQSRYGISLEIITGRGAEFTERMKTEKRMGRRMADVTEGSSTLLNNMKLEKLLTPVFARLPVAREKQVWAMAPTALDPDESTVLIYTINTYSPYINTNLVKTGQEPRVWKDLLAAQWKGKMVLNDPNIASDPYRLFVVLMENKLIDEEYIKALYRQDLRFAISTVEGISIAARGERSLHVILSEATTGRFASEGAPIKAIDMKDATILGGTGYAMVEGGPQPNASQVFTNWVFSQEGQAVIGQAGSVRMVRKDVPDFRHPAIKFEPTTAFLLTETLSNRATELFREKWFDKLVGR